VEPKYEPQGVLLRLIGHQFTGLGNVETERDGSAGFLVSLGLHGQGGGGPLGHPRVYLNLGPAGSVVCPYCSRRFALREGATVPAH